MKSQTEYLTLNIPARMAFQNITPQVEEIVRKSAVQEGIVLCNAMHITASVFINDDETGLLDDYKKWLETFLVMDALALKKWTERFDNVIDSGLFHVFNDDDRRRYVDGVATVLKPGSRLFLLCFSDEEPGTQGPRRVSRQEIKLPSGGQVKEGSSSS